MDEEVPDSDGEEYLPLQPKLVTPFTPAAAVPTDSISPFSAAKAASTKDSISSSSSVVRPPRPRPKPTYKGAPGHPSNLAETSFIGSFSDSVPSSLSDRVKMRNRVVSKVSAPDSTSSSSHRPAVVSTDVIEIDSSEDELISNSKPKAASNKKPAVKSKDFALTTSSSSNVPIPSPRQPSPNLPTTIPFPSQLPPSDPFPQSTGMSRYHPEHEGDGEGSIPPIATLTAAGDTSFEPDSSPSRRKEKARPKPKPKPKKPKPPVPDSQDQLQYDFVADGFGGNRDTRTMPPPLDPPTIPLVIRLPPVARPSTSLTGSASNPDTLPDLLTGAPSDKLPKKRKKKADDEGDKEKPPKKPRVKKAKKDAEGGEAGGEDKSKKKGKGKEKEEFKSAEFITDEDDPVAPGDAAPLVPPPLPSLMDGVLGGGSAQKPVSVISIPDSQADEEELVPLRKRKRATEEDEDNAADRNAKDTGKETTTVKKNKKVKTAGATVDKTKKKAPAKKAKGRTVLSDDEEDGAGGEAPVPFDTIVVNSGGPIPDTTTTDPPTQTGSDAGDEALQAKVKPAKKKKVAKKTVVSESEEEGDEAFQNKPNENSPPRPSSKSQVENTTFDGKTTASPKQKNPEETPKPLYPSISSRYTIASRTKSTPMAELIRRASSRPGSPFPAVVPRSRTSSLGGGASGTPTTSYSPYNKFSRSALSRIAPLHPNRRTPPPLPPPPPPKPKTKKEKEREERWEEEMIEAVGGWDEWKLLSEQEQKAARRAKWARELEGWDD